MGAGIDSLIDADATATVIDTRGRIECPLAS
jgi:hypothetical protein